MEFEIRANMADVSARLASVASEQIPFATALALTWTAKDVLAAEKRTMGQVFDRPTPFSKNAFQVVPATKTRLVASVVQKTATGTSHPRNWFNPQVHGGTRRHKAFERHLIAVGAMPSNLYAVPSRACPKDAYGNVRGSVIMQILSDLGAQAVDVWQNASARSRRRNRRERFFLLKASNTPLAIAINKGGRLVVYFNYVRTPNYRKRFPFYEVGQSVGEALAATNFRKAFTTAIASRRRG
ncbi:hypothetical protein [Pleomorphomonas sp. JP5]|uniref:hypothetical protein n=1 Tax=Pleomorphomonas sp. JP5 TaxID=2942998 RepID=UPI0020444322|nr:hypothetical protein [Pleomorphomonas sp. JP5]MCM5560303.1 hypothetical protein [Pleomorphomonas sp. JP5]